MIHRSLSPCVLDIFVDLRQNSVRYFSAWMFPPLEVVLVFCRLCRRRLVFVLSWRFPPLEVVLVISVVDVDVAISAGGEGFRPRSCGL